MNEETSTFGSLEGFTELCSRLSLVQDSVKRISAVQDLCLLTDSLKRGALFYITDEKHIDKFSDYSDVAVLVPDKMRVPSHKESFIPVEDPSFVFWSLYEFSQRKKLFNEPSKVDRSAIIGTNVSIAACNVEIGPEVIIENNVVVHPGVAIHSRARIGSGSVIGSEGLEVKRTVFGLTVITHRGGVVIEKDVSLGALCTVNQGLGEIPTYIGADTKIDCGVHIAHSCAIGSENIIAANAAFGGSVTTGKDVFVGINATIVNGITLADGCFVGAGAVVTETYRSAVKLISLRAKAQKR